MQTPDLAVGGCDFPYPGCTSAPLFWTMGRPLPLHSRPCCCSWPCSHWLSAAPASSQAPHTHPAAGSSWILGCGGARLWLLIAAGKLRPKSLVEKQKSKVLLCCLMDCPGLEPKWPLSVPPAPLGISRTLCPAFTLTLS